MINKTRKEIEAMKKHLLKETAMASLIGAVGGMRWGIIGAEVGAMAMGGGVAIMGAKEIYYLEKKRKKK